MWDHPPWCVYFPHSKWKADRGPVTSLCVSPDGKLLLSAGQTIKMWDLDTKEVYRVSLHIWDGVTWYEEIMSDRALLSDACLRHNVTPPLQKFTGHSTAVTTLCFATTRPPDSNGLYFLSGAAHDRLLSVWWVLARLSPLIYSSATLGRLSPFYKLASPPHRQVREDGKDKNSVVSFALTDEPQHIDLIASKSREEVRVTEHPFRRVCNQRLG